MRLTRQETQGFWKGAGNFQIKVSGYTGAIILSTKPVNMLGTGAVTDGV